MRNYSFGEATIILIVIKIFGIFYCCQVLNIPIAFLPNQVFTIMASVKQLKLKSVYFHRRENSFCELNIMQFELKTVLIYGNIWIRLLF